MPIIVFVWEPKGSESPGHASLSIQGGPYISWWPKPGATDKELFFKGQAWAKSMSSDIERDEFNAGIRNELDMPNWASAPITTLDEDAITKWWIKISGRSGSREDEKGVNPAADSYYGFFSNNCSNMVLTALHVGGLRKNHFASAVANAAGKIITPNDIKDIASAITGELGFWDTARIFVDVNDMWDVHKYFTLNK